MKRAHLTAARIDAYEQYVGEARNALAFAEGDAPMPHGIRIEALAALAKSRDEDLRRRAVDAPDERPLQLPACSPTATGDEEDRGLALAAAHPPGHAAFMGHPAEKPRRATYADLEAVPAGKVAELIGGVLHVMPRPAPRHANVEGGVLEELRSPFQRGCSGPGGWWILPEPELHFPDPAVQGEIEALAPDVAGWRRTRLSDLPDTAYFALAPDWICEVLSKSTEDTDRNEKMPIYAREGVRHAWLIDPIARTLEVYLLGPGRRWGEPLIHTGAKRVRVPPFEAIELDLTALWA